MFFRAIWDKYFIMFLKTNLGYLSQIAQKNMQLLILIYKKFNIKTKNTNVRISHLIYN